MTRLFLNLGKDQSLTPGDIINAFSTHGNIHGKEIGKIDIKNKFSFVDVPKSLSNDLINELKNQKIKGHKINLEVSSK